MRQYKILAEGSLAAEQVHQSRVLQDELWAPPAELVSDIELRWQQALEDAERSGRLLFDAPIFRLNDLQWHGASLNLQFGVTRYRHYAMMRGQCAKQPWTNNPDPVGSALIVITADGLVPIGRRRPSADVNPNRFFTFGGFFDYLQDLTPAGTPDIFGCVRREFREESGLDLQLDQLRLISVVYDLRHPHPEIGFTVNLNHTGRELLDANWTSELGDIALIPQSTLWEFSNAHAEDFTDSLLGAVEAFERHRHQ